MIAHCSSFEFLILFFFFKQKTAYEMRISDWSSDVCSSDLPCGWKSHGAADWRYRVCTPACKDDSPTGRQMELLLKNSGLGRSHARFCAKSRWFYALKNRLFIREIGRASCRERVCQYV